MKKLKKWCLGFLSFILLFLVGTFIFHRISLEKEQASLTPMGQRVLVNGHQMNVYVEGDGPETIVVLSGAGIASPILDFKNVSDSLSKRYKVVIVERDGYGYSDDSNHSRDVMEVCLRHVKLFLRLMSQGLLLYYLILWLVSKV